MLLFFSFKSFEVYFPISSSLETKISLRFFSSFLNENTNLIVEKIYNHRNPYTNVYATKVDFWKQHDVWSLLSTISLSNSQLINRWGDHTVQGILLNHKNTKIWSQIKNNSPFYFVHSYKFQTDDPDHVLATCTYGEEHVASVRNDNIIGMQFHPEKSHDAGKIFIK